MHTLGGRRTDCGSAAGSAELPVGCLTRSLTMGFCSHCGNELAADAQFCHRCGAAVAPTAAPVGDVLVFGTPRPSRPRVSKRGVILAAVVVVVILGAVGTYFAISHRPHKTAFAACLVGQWRITNEQHL